MARREAPEISAGSMADIAFLLLVFFLVTSEMTKEEGMMQLLPEITNEEQTEEVNRRNVISVLVNDNNDVLFAGKPVTMKQIPGLVKEMILNEADKADWPENKPVQFEKIQARVTANEEALKNAPEEKIKDFERKLKKAKLRMKAYEIFGDSYKTSKHVVNVQATQGAEYQTYITLKNQIKVAYRELRASLAKKKLGKNWDDLSKDELEMLEMVYKENISEAPIVSGASK